jgi:glycosyltransferase involved in cell wall biosynthesis
MGARVVDVPRRGYGSALMAGIGAARGELVALGVADDSYDFTQLDGFVAKLREGADLVQGCRLPSGGGRVARGAMPFTHRWIGNPLFSFLARRWFWAPVHDVYCGLRAFRKSLVDGLDQRCTGMEFATEMIIRAALTNARIAEVPITLYRDGRKAHPAHLRTLRDGWRTLRFFLLSSPGWLFFRPGLALIAFGVAGYLIAMPGLRIGGVHFDVHTLLVASLALLLGYEAVLFALFAKTMAIEEGVLPQDRRLSRVFALATLERVLACGAVAACAGIALILVAANRWRAGGYGALDYGRSMRWVIPGAALIAFGFQTILAGFFATLVRWRR